MSSEADSDIAQYIRPLKQNGLSGRLLHKPASEGTTSREILYVYGQHSSIERWWGLIEELSRYGAVTVPDLPGYGGMQSLFSVGKKPTFDELADYLADFIHDYYGSKSFCIVGLSIGFAIVTRMLQRHPELTAQVSLLVSVVGFAHHDDFIFRKRRVNFYVYASNLFLIRPFDLVLKHLFFNPVVLRRAYHRSFNAREKFANLSGDEFSRTMDMEVELWQINDLRTWLLCNIEMFHLDNTQVRVDLDVLNLSVRKDRYFDPERVEGHLRQIFRGYDHVRLPTDSHGPSVIATAEEAAVLIPQELRDLLGKT